VIGAIQGLRSRNTKISHAKAQTSQEKLWNSRPLLFFGGAGVQPVSVAINLKAADNAS